jgi:predicted signal transduction protein with EAL and GGDEF domain
MAQPSDPTAPAPLTVDDLIAKVRDLDAKRTASAAAHVATLQATQHVTDVTVTEQANIDAATAQYDRETTAAKAEATDATNAEAAAEAEEQAVFEDLEASLLAFKNG